MNAPISDLDRRRFLIGAGALVVLAPSAAYAAQRLPEGGAPPSTKPPLHPAELDSWVAVAPDGQVTAFFGKPDVGQGVDVAIAQIVAEELDVAVDRVTVVGGDGGALLVRVLGVQRGSSNAVPVPVPVPPIHQPQSRHPPPPPPVTVPTTTTTTTLFVATTGTDTDTGTAGPSPRLLKVAVGADAAAAVAAARVGHVLWLRGLQVCM